MRSPTPEVPPVQARRAAPLATLLMTAVAAVAHVLLQAASLIFNDRGPLTGVRLLAVEDQLGYLAIVHDVAAGRLDAMEPYTDTGQNTYPSGYFRLVGSVSRILRLSDSSAWNLVGLLAMAAAVAALAWLLIRMTGRAWVALLAPLPFLVGPLAWLQGQHWHVPLLSHATLWGPYGVNTPLNAETAGLAIVTIALVILGHVWLLPTPRRIQEAVTVVAAIMVGALANVHTYSFVAGVYLLAGLVAARGLTKRSWRWSVATAALVVLVYALGPVLRDSAGQLAILAFGLLPMLPGLAAMIVDSRGRLILPMVAAVMAAAPQVAATILAMLAQDPFLAYRVDSPVNLGVWHPATLLASLPVAVPLAIVTAAGARAQDHWTLVCAGAPLVLWPYLATNDLWGVNAEPYRLWISMFLISALLLLISLTRMWVHPPQPASAALATGRPRLITAATAAALAGLLLSLPDYVVWATDSRVQSTWNTRTSRMRAVSDVLTSVDNSALVLVDPCLDPQTANIVSQANMAHYRPGMAWPERKVAIDVVVEDLTARGFVDPTRAQAADVGWLLVDTSCDGGWVLSAGSAARHVTETPYTPEPDEWQGAPPAPVTSTGTPAIALWRLAD